MAVISAILYFLSQHPFWSMLLIPIVGFILVRILIRITKRLSLFGLMIPIGIYAMLNIFLGSWLNAAFLAHFGTTGSGVITHQEETNSTLNENPIWYYDVALKTAEGEDVVSQMDTMSASIYPITNAILIPPMGERFTTRYIPGFDRNFVIMRNESPYGIAYQMALNREPVEKARRQWETSTSNPRFIAEYRSALMTFIGKHRDTAPPVVIGQYQAQLDALPTQ